MNPVESIKSQPESNSAAKDETTVKKPQELPELVEAYLLELEETLDPSEAYEIVYPAGHQYGYAGLTAEYPALSSTGAIASLRWIFQHARLQSVKECQQYVIQPLEDPLGRITKRYVVDSDGRIRKVTVPQRLHPPSKVT